MSDVLTLGPIDLINEDRKERKRLHIPEPQPVVFKTPGLECAHADKGCCSLCLPSTQRLHQPKFRVHVSKGVWKDMHVHAAANDRARVRKAS